MCPFFRLSCVFPALPQCLGSELPLLCVRQAVELLSVLVDHDSLTQQLCSHSGKQSRTGLNCPILGGRGWGRDRFRAPQGLLYLYPRLQRKGDPE